ncbi:VOC family protein [Prauserella flavalba]|uniref:VOC family protein n=1 Tax=Prauserella flavalba TaxID=1477506 RepID=UPI0036F0C352
MVTRDTPWPDGTPCWVDLMAPDPRMAIDFYGALFAWAFADQGDETGNYLLASLGGRLVAGVGGMPPGQEDAPAAWTTYLATSDLGKTVAMVVDHGGQVMVPPTAVGPAGRLAVAADPTGAVFGLWQAGEHNGVGLANAAGSLNWNECLTRDYDRARDFYAAVFGHTFEDMSDEGFRYSTLKAGGKVVGGVGLLPDEVPADVPPHWAVYFAVSDTDATVARVTELGGELVREPWDSLYGRLAQVTDNQGAHFRVITATEAP